MIRIKENATKSNSFLSGRSILLDKDAKSDAIPGLEILQMMSKQLTLHLLLRLTRNKSSILKQDV